MSRHDQHVRLAGGFFALALAIGGCALAVDSEQHAAAPAHDEADPVQPGDDTLDVGDVQFARKASDAPVHETVANTPLGSFPIKYRVVDGDALAEGDMIIGSGELESATSIGRLWPNKTIPYVIDADFPQPTRATSAIAHWQSFTSMRFVPRTNEADYIHFRSAGGCSSNIGQWGGRQFVNLATSNRSADVVGVAINRSSGGPPEGLVYWYYGAGIDNQGYTNSYATVGTLADPYAYRNHFRFLPAPGKLVADIIDVAFDSNGHLFAWYKDGTVSVGDFRDFASYSAARPFVPGPLHTVADLVGFAIDTTDHVHAFYKDGTSTVGTSTDLAALRGTQTLGLAPGQAGHNLSKVEVDGQGNFVALYNDIPVPPTDGSDAGPPRLITYSLTISKGTDLDLAAVAPAAGKLGYGFGGYCSAGATVHEIGHAVGLYHEQTRHDRDQYIQIDFDNVAPGDVFNFQKHSHTQGVDVGPYDFGSIMHYGPDAFSLRPKSFLDAAGKTQSCSQWKPEFAEQCKDTWTIIPIVDVSTFDAGYFAEQRRGLSTGDIAAVGQLYPGPPPF